MEFVKQQATGKGPEDKVTDERYRAARARDH